jgi:hypothetical protein
MPQVRLPDPTASDRPSLKKATAWTVSRGGSSLAIVIGIDAFDKASSAEHRIGSATVSCNNPASAN